MRRRIGCACVAAILAAVLVTAGLFGLHKVRRPHPSFVASAQQPRDPGEVASRLRAAVARDPRLSLSNLGDIQYGEFTAPIWRVSFAPPDAQRRILLTAGVHGNEPAGTESLIRFVENFAAEAEKYPGTAFEIIPLVNPWGWTNKRRLTQQGYDINRDFASFSSPEARLLRDFLDANEFDAAIEHHEDSSAPGFYLYQIANKRTDLCRGVVDALRATGFPIEQDTTMVIFKTRDGVLYTPLWALHLARLGKALSLGNYIRLTECEAVFLFESPSSRPLEERLSMLDAAREVILRGL